MKAYTDHFLFIVTTLMLSTLANNVTADGTDELMNDIGTADARLGLRSGAAVFVEIQNVSEQICIEAGGSATVDVQGPYTNDALPGAFVPGGDDFSPNGSCLTPTGAGIFRVLLNGSFSSSSRWDISVCDSAAPMAVCDASEANAAHIDGRVYSFEWLFRSSNNQTPSSGLSASLYARLTLTDGANVDSGVIQLQLLGFNGLASWEVVANDSGVAGLQKAKSTIITGNSISSQYPLYLAQPDENFRAYSIITTAVSDFSFDAGVSMQTCTSIEPGVNSGKFSFKTQYNGRYRVICDLDGDSEFETNGTDDLILSGDALAEGPIGTTINEVMWDGKDNGGANVASGDYDCIVTVAAGEFHYIAPDMEVAFEGIRMFSVGPGPANTRAGLNIFWDDTDVTPAVAIAMQDGTFPSPISPALGLDPGDDPNAAATAYGLDAMGMTVAGNARGWGSFVDPCPAIGSCSTNGNGDIGDDDFMDTWAALTSAASTSLSVTILGSGDDCDMDGRTDQQESCIDGTNPCGCTDAGAATPASPDDECTMAEPACAISGGVGMCEVCLDTATMTGQDEGCASGSAQICDDTATTPECVPCYDDSTGVDETCGGSGSALAFCKVDGADSSNNACVECVSDSDCDAGDVCDQTNNTCMTSDEVCTDDSMCVVGVCDTTNEECVACVDDGNGMDRGCSAATPSCETTGGVSSCVPATIGTVGGLSGGALCTLSQAPSSGLPVMVGALSICVALMRRRQR